MSIWCFIGLHEWEYYRHQYPARRKCKFCNKQQELIWDEWCNVK